MLSFIDKVCQEQGDICCKKESPKCYANCCGGLMCMPSKRGAARSFRCLGIETSCKKCTSEHCAIK